MLKRSIIMPMIVALVGAGLGLWTMVTPAQGVAPPLQPLTITKTASEVDHVVPPGTVWYDIAVSNPNNVTVYLTNIVDTLPSGFTYNTGSYGGLATFDPDVVGQTLTWAFDGENVGAGSTAHLTFSADVSADEPLGMYCNNASVDWVSGSASTGPTAAVQVLNEGQNPTTPTCPGGRVMTATPTVTVTAPATATEVPATSTPVPPAPPTATETKPAGGSAGVISAPNTGSGPSAGGPSMLLLAIAASMVIGGAGAAAVGARRR